MFECFYGSWNVSAKANWISCRHVNMNPIQYRLWLKMWGWSGVRSGGGGWDLAVGPSGWVVGVGRIIEVQLLVQAFAGSFTGRIFAPTRVVHQDGLP